MSKSVRTARPRIPNCLWKYRKRMGFTQWQAAKLLGFVSRTQIAHLERGDKLPRLVTALKLEILYRVPVAFLFPGHYARLKAAIREKENRLRAEWGEYEETP